MSTVTAFNGFNNVTDPLRLGLNWLARADNIDITDTGAIRKRGGYRKTFPGAFTGAYSTLDFKRLFVVDGGVLKAMTGLATAVSLLAVPGSAPMHFTEVNDQVFFNNGSDRGIILPDNSVLDWDWPTPDTPQLAAVTGRLPAGLYRVCCTFVLPGGRETGNSDMAEIALGEGQALQITGIPQIDGLATRVYIAPADSTVFQAAGMPTISAMVWNEAPENLGCDLLTDGLSQLPDQVDVIQFWRGRMYAAQYFAAADQTAVWFSQPLGFHLFNLSENFILVPGRVTMLAPHDDALVIGSDTRIHAYDGNTLTPLAPYGVVPGWHWVKDGNRTLFWTARGLCAALPFANLTDRQVSVAPGLQAGGVLVERDGRKRYLVALHQGGTAFNSHL